MKRDEKKIRRREGAWHLITCEYPPRTGGVGDYARLVAVGLAAEGDEVHVWCPSHVAKESEVVACEVRGAADESRAEADGDRVEDGEPASSGVVVHGEFGRFAPSDLRRVGRLLGGFETPRRLLVQYVPHGYGLRAMNAAFCAWLLWRARVRGDAVELMVHEPFLEFAGSLRQRAAASVQRLMAALLLGSARRVRVSIPAWGELLRPYALGRSVPFEWLPVPSTVPVVEDAARTASVRVRYVAQPDGLLVGHFGTYPPHASEQLARVLVPLLARRENCAALLLGRGGESLRERIVREHPSLGARLHSTGTLHARTLSSHIAACDLLLLPFPDGVSTRRTSAMAALAHAAAVVTTRGRLTEPLWDESRAVALVPPGDAGAMLDATERLLDDEGERARLSSSARSLYGERFDLARTVSALRRDAGDDGAAREILTAEAKV